MKFNFSEDIKNICREVFRRNQVDYFDPEDETTRTPKYQKWERKHPNLFKDPAERVLLRQLVNFERSIIAPLSWTVKECEGVKKTAKASGVDSEYDMLTSKWS